MSFSGFDWCDNCTRLDKELFQTAEFTEFVANNLVLLKLDFPAKKEQTFAKSDKAQLGFDRETQQERGLSITPVFEIFRWKDSFRKNKINMLRSIDLRCARYNRSNGLNANVWTVGINFAIDR
ncbi:MAG: hypothetical protein ACJATE_001947 [Bacteroidia bacterium]|jgi:hypothetical protein